jgi:hypothetical protein
LNRSRLGREAWSHTTVIRKTLGPMNFFSFLKKC